MNNFTKEAIKVLQDAYKEYGDILENFCHNQTEEDISEVNTMYNLDSKLKVLISQFADASQPTTKEGNIIVHNDLSMVEIDHVKITGDIQFELLIDGNWIKGHRMNTSMGQSFIHSAGNIILTSDYKGRVTFPLTFDQ